MEITPGSAFVTNVYFVHSDPLLDMHLYIRGNLHGPVIKAVLVRLKLLLAAAAALVGRPTLYLCRRADFKLFGRVALLMVRAGAERCERVRAGASFARARRRMCKRMRGGIRRRVNAGEGLGQAHSEEIWEEFIKEGLEGCSRAADNTDVCFDAIG